MLPITGKTLGLESLGLANEVLGDGFLSRLNMLIREDKGWSYGVRSGFSTAIGPRILYVSAPVQADRTADSLELILQQMNAFAGGKGRGRQGRTEPRYRRQHPRPAQPASKPADRCSARCSTCRRAGCPTITTPTSLRPIVHSARMRSMPRRRQYLGGKDLAVVIVGDRKVIDPQLAKLGMPIEYQQPR